MYYSLSVMMQDGSEVLLTNFLRGYLPIAKSFPVLDIPKTDFSSSLASDGHFTVQIHHT